MASKPLSKKRSNPKKVKMTPIAERPIPISAKEYVKTHAAARLTTQLYATMFLMSVHSDHIEELQILLLLSSSMLARSYCRGDSQLL